MDAEESVSDLLQTFRADLNQENLDVSFTAGGLSVALLYLCGSLNYFSKAHGSELAPCVVSGGTPKGSFTLLGATSCLNLCVTGRP